MQKLIELNGWELMTVLAEIAEPVGNLANDDTFWDCFVACTKRGINIRQKDTLRFLARTYAQLIPLLLNEHKKDTFRILAAIEGRPIDEVMKMNGKELLEDIKEAFSTTLAPFFTKFAPTEKRE